MPLTSGYTQICDTDCSGGVLQVAVMDKSDILSLTWATTAQMSLTAITVSAPTLTGFQKIELDIEHAEYTGTETKNETGCGYSSTAEVMITVDCAGPTLTDFLQQIKDLCCSGLVVAVETSSGVRLFGIRDFERSYLTTTADTVEKTFAGRNDTTFTLNHKGRKSPAFWTGVGGFNALPFITA